MNKENDIVENLLNEQKKLQNELYNANKLKKKLSNNSYIIYYIIYILSLLYLYIKHHFLFTILYF